MTFGDDNTLEDIHGLVLTILADVHVEKPEFPVRPRLVEVIARIEQKLARNANAARANWFNIALSHAKTAQECFEHGNPAGVEAALEVCWKNLESGNKAHRRSATFVVAPNGQVTRKL